MTEKEVEIKQPLFYDLTQLQREANIRFGLSAQATLDAAQILWDAKLITYPRSASQHISTTINEQIDKHLDALVDITDESFAHLASGARLVKERGYALTKRHVDDKKLLEGHYGILPSGETPDFTRLPNAARQLYDLIGRRFIAAFFPPARDARTEIITACGEHQFLTRGVRELVSGWRSIDPPSRVVEEKAEADTDEQIGVLLPKVTRGESVQRIDSQKLSKKTRAPQRYTEASLLEAMESAGQHCETEEERLAMKVCGLGMPSTRASTIRRAFELHYFEHEGKRYVRSTAVAREVIRRLRAFNSLLVSPAMTGKWEAVLARIAAGERDARSFRQSVVELTRKLVAEILGSVSADVESNDAFQSAANVGECPQCKVAGRSGRLRVCSGKGGKFFGCQLPRDVCGYISDFTQKSKELKALIKKRCPDDGRAMRLRHGKKTETPYLSCTGYPDCKRVVFFEEKVKQARPAAAKSKLKERLPSNAAT